MEIISPADFAKIHFFHRNKSSLMTSRSQRILQFSGLVLALVIMSCTTRSAEDPSAELPEVQIEEAGIRLLAREPDIVTPTGVQVDDKNRVWVIENHTHVRQDDYPGPPADRILVFSGYLDKDQEERITEFATDFIDGMSLSFSPGGKVLITTRAAIIQFTDEDGDLVADQRDTLIALRTRERFPHNGMSGLAVGPDGRLYFQCGENFGADYELAGTDGVTLYGKEREGGSLYRCAMNGSGLERIGTAVWNCFAMTFDDFGNLFAVENDPDSRPPCRLLHIVKGGNYGFQFQHGRDGLSPLTSWFGQLPGTLPMVAGTGEAPSGVLYYSTDKLGSAIEGALLVTAWGDNEIQRFKIHKKGSSFTAEGQPLVKGSRDFYPVGLAMDDRAGIIVTDWASVSYAVHGKGRIWRVAHTGKADRIERFNASDEPDDEELMRFLDAPDPRIRAAAADYVIASHSSRLAEYFHSAGLSDRGKMNLLWSAQLNDHPGLPDLLGAAMQEKNELLRSAAVRMMVEQPGAPKESYFLDLIQNDPAPFVIREAIYGLHSERAFESIKDHFKAADPFLHTAIIETFGKEKNIGFLSKFARHADPKIRLGALLCLRRSGAEQAKALIPAFLRDPVIDNRITVLKWVAEDDLKAYRNQVEQSFNQVREISPLLFDAYLATFQYLDGTFDSKSHFMEGDEHVSRSFYKRQKFLLATAKNSRLNDEIRTRALSGINPNYPDLTLQDLRQFAEAPNTSLQIEAVRSLGVRTEDPSAVSFLQQIARDNERSQEVRLEAIAALANSVKDNQESKNLLLNILQNSDSPAALKAEASRSLTPLTGDSEARPWLEAYQKTLPAGERVSAQTYWKQLGQEQGDPVAGARTFFSARYQCSSCHRINGRGGIFGPDLSQVGSNANRERIIESILMPDDIVTPAFAGYAVSTKAGEVTVGRLDKDLDSKRHLQMILANGERAAIAYDDIAEQKLLSNSLMPPNLHRNMTADEFRNLIQFLAERK